MNPDPDDKFGPQWPTTRYDGPHDSPEADWERRVAEMREQAAQDQRDAAAAEPATPGQDSRRVAERTFTPPEPVYEPCERCGEPKVNVAYRRDGRLLCGKCRAYVYRFGDQPISTAEALVLVARVARNKLRRAGR